jgi:hypothetical protein
MSHDHWIWDDEAEEWVRQTKNEADERVIGGDNLPADHVYGGFGYLFDDDTPLECGIENPEICESCT